MKKGNWVYDVECFPNFFSNTLINLKTGEKQVFYVHGEVNQLEEMIDFIQHHVLWLIGYNSSKYDDIVLRFIMSNFYLVEADSDRVTNELYELSKEIIGSQRGGNSIWRNPKIKPYLKEGKWFQSMDLMSMMYFDKMMIGLKKVAVAMKWPLIQDLPKPFDEPVTLEEVPAILHYNENDVLITKQLAIEQKSEMKIRMDVGGLYGINLMSASRSSMADKLMVKFWEEETGQKFWDFRKDRTTYESINLGECISEKVQFRTPLLQKLLEDIKSTVWRDKDKFSHRVKVGNTAYDILLGGIHSVKDPLIYESSEEYDLKDVDVASYYPNLMLNEGAFPAHLSERFLDLYQRLVTQRLTAKRGGDKLTADALKIVVNATYGKLNFEYGWLYDTKACYRVTLTGQLYLLMLIEALELNGIEVFYANTDGITCKVSKDKTAKFEEICDAWQKYTYLELEGVDYKKCVIRDVNNFLIMTEGGDTKTKGCFVTEIDMTKGYNNPVVPKAVYEYYVNGTPIRETIEGHTDVYDFCKSQKVGWQYSQEYHTLVDSKLVVTPCQKTNRYYVSRGVGKLFKRKKSNNQLTDLVSGFNVTLLNEPKEYEEFSDYNVNYDYYVHEAQKIVRTMEPTQLGLF